MIGPDPSRTGPAGPTPGDAALPDDPGRPTPGRLERLADLVADGQAELPDGLDPADERRLAELVRRRHRDRLVRFIARQIALDIHRELADPE